jgi:hypothetical protein
MLHVRQRGEIHTVFWCEDVRERDRFKDKGVDGFVILRYILKLSFGGAWTGLICLRTGTGGGMLWTQWRSFDFHKTRGISWLAEDLLAAQKGLSYMEVAG